MTHSARSSPGTRLFPATLAAAVLGFGAYLDHAASSDAPAQERVAATDDDLAREAASAEVRHVAQWAIATQDHAGLPFVVIDPGQARIYAFDPQGHLTGHASMRMRPNETPAVAGRLVADPIASARSGAIVWTKADTELTLGASDEDASQSQSPQPALRVEPDFWRTCLATLRTQPSIAYVLPSTAASIREDAERRPS